MTTLSPRAWLARAADVLRRSLWPIPAVSIAAAVGLAAVTLSLDTSARDPSVLPIFRVGAEGARATLGALATALMTIAGVSFSMTMIVLQLASGQFSPRVVRSFLRDWIIQLIFGAYVGTFTYVLIVLRAIRAVPGASGESTAPVSVSVAALLGLVCVVLMVVFVHHVAGSLQASAVVDRITEETKHTLHTLYPDQLGDDLAQEERFDRPEGAPRLVRAATAGYLSYVDADALDLDDAYIAIEPLVGDFVRRDDVIARVWSDAPHLEPVFASAFVFSHERTMQQDVRFGFHLLADVAVRALSPGINDPTTAVYCVNRLGDLLCRLVTQAFPPSHRRIDTVRIVAPRPELSDVVRLAFEPIVVFGRCDARVLGAILDALEAVNARDRHRRADAVAAELASAIAAVAAEAPTWTPRQRETLRRRSLDLADRFASRR